MVLLAKTLCGDWSASSAVPRSAASIASQSGNWPSDLRLSGFLTRDVHYRKTVTSFHRKSLFEWA
jgi:hypothetical protein